jgi:hypothetical protein
VSKKSGRLKGTLVTVPKFSSILICLTEKSGTSTNQKELLVIPKSAQAEFHKPPPKEFLLVPVLHAAVQLQQIPRVNTWRESSSSPSRVQFSTSHATLLCAVVSRILDVFCSKESKYGTASWQNSSSSPGRITQHRLTISTSHPCSENLQEAQPRPRPLQKTSHWHSSFSSQITILKNYNSSAQTQQHNV